MNETDLIPFVRYIVNEAGIPDDPFSLETDAAIREFIRSAMVQLASMPSYQGAPSILNDTASVTFSARPDGLFCAVIRPPQNFLRPVSVNLEGWVRPVYEFLPAVGTPFLKQYSSVPGIGSGPSSPVAFITPDGQNLIIAHAVKKVGDYNLRYVAIPEIESDGTICIPSLYREALAYTASALYMQSINEYDAAKVAFDTAGSFIQTINNKTVQ